MALRLTILALVIGLMTPLASATVSGNTPQAESLSIGDVTVTEGNTGTVAATFTVTLSGPSLDTVTVDYATGDGTATAPADYSTAGGPLTFLPGETSQTVTVASSGMGWTRRRDLHRRPRERGQRDDRGRPRVWGRSPTTTPARPLRSTT